MDIYKLLGYSLNVSYLVRPTRYCPPCLLLPACFFHLVLPGTANPLLPPLPATACLLLTHLVLPGTAHPLLPTLPATAPSACYCLPASHSTPLCPSLSPPPQVEDHEGDEL